MISPHPLLRFVHVSRARQARGAPASARRALSRRHAPEADLRRIPGPQWYRFQRAVEPTDLAFLVITPRPSVPSAQLRLVLNSSHSVAALEVERPMLSAALDPTLNRQRLPASLTG